MNPEIAKTIAAFLARVNLQGGEVPAYNACMQELTRIVDADIPPPANEEQTESAEEVAH